MKKICLIISCMIALFVLLFISENYNNKRIEAETTKGTISTVTEDVTWVGTSTRHVKVDAFGTSTSNLVDTGNAENFTVWVKNTVDSGTAAIAVYYRESITYDRRANLKAEYTGTSTIVHGLVPSDIWTPYTITPSQGAWVEFLVKGSGAPSDAAGTSTVKIKIASK